MAEKSYYYFFNNICYLETIVKVDTIDVVKWETVYQGHKCQS